MCVLVCVEISSVKNDMDLVIGVAVVAAQLAAEFLPIQDYW